MINVRKYENKDLNSVNTILKESFNITKENFNYSNIEEVVVELDNNVVGYTLVTKILNPLLKRYYYFLDYVCVSPSSRGHGIGKYLLDYIEDEARQDNAMYIQLTCGKTRLSAHKLYEKCGFVKRETDLFRKVL